MHERVGVKVCVGCARVSWSMCPYAFVCEHVRVRVCVFMRDNVCVSVCVCVRERERERESTFTFDESISSPHQAESRRRTLSL